MKNLIYLVVLFILVVACKQKEEPVIFTKYDETSAIASQQNHDPLRLALRLPPGQLVQIRRDR